MYSLHAGLVAAGTDEIGDVAGRAGFSALRIMVSLPARVTTLR